MFRARTTQSGKLKALFDVLFSNTQDVMLTISSKGIESELTTVNDATINVLLPHDGFDEYEYTYDEPLYIGLGAHVNNTILKEFKNKNTITMSISNPYTLDIYLQCDDCTISYSAAFMCAQNICQAQSYDYDHSKAFSVATSMFNSMCKSFSKTSSVNVKKQEGQLSFSFELSGIASKALTFGQKDPNQINSYVKKFKSDTFFRIGKLSSFAAKPIRMYAEDDKPFMIMAESTLGTVRVTITAEDIFLE